MSQLRPEDSEKARRCEAVRDPFPIFAPSCARSQAASDRSAMLSRGGLKPRSRDVAERRDRAEIDGKRQEFPANFLFLNYRLTLNNTNRDFFQKIIRYCKLNYIPIYRNENKLYSIIEFYNRKRN